jgi:hypothetical protein
MILSNSGFRTEVLYVFLIFVMRVTCPDHLTLSNTIMLINYKTSHYEALM